ncbi:MAG TPA: hypothetical protein PLW93_06490, partial [Candidatus Absconditabacterales bacterium]|nr:hypothetical protein [Candidatus Absconditabacterales bacterium]
HAPTDIVKSVVDKAPEVVKTVTTGVRDTVTNASHEIGAAASNIGSSLSWPLAAAIAGLGAVYLLKNKGIAAFIMIPILPPG